MSARSDEYELMPVVELEKLRQEVAALKEGHVSTAGASIQHLQQSIDTLTSTMNRLLKVFSSIDEELIAKAHAFDAYESQLSELRTQNEHIAHGIVTLAHLIGEQQQQSSYHEDEQSVSEQPEEPFTPESEPPTTPHPQPEQGFEQSQTIPVEPEQRYEPSQTPSYHVDEQSSVPVHTPNPQLQEVPEPPQIPPSQGSLSVPAQRQSSQDAWSVSAQQSSGQDPWEIPQEQPLPPQNPSAQQSYDQYSEQEPVVEPLPFSQEQPPLQDQSAPQGMPPQSENKKGLFGLFK